MITKVISVKRMVAFFEKEYHDVLGRLDELYEATKNLQFEGKVSSGKNIKVIERVIDYLKKKLFLHIALDEKIIFPFLEAHIPKLTVVLSLLRAERNEFKANLEDFESLFSKLKEEKNDQQYYKLVRDLREKGIYLVCLMRNHIQVENESIYKIIDQELHNDEKKELLRRCSHSEKD